MGSGCCKRVAGVLGALGLWLSLTPTLAQAGNDDGILLGDDAPLTGGAVVATGSDGAMLYYNPAGLARARHLNTLDASGSAFTLRNHSAPELLSSYAGEDGDGSFSEFVPLPSTLTYVRQLGPRTTVGAGLFVPEALDYVLRTGLLVDDGDIDARWQVALTEEYARYATGVGFAWALSDRVLVGLGLMATYFKSLYSLQVAGGAQLGGGVAFGAATELNESTIVGTELSAGVLVQPTPSVSLGFSLRSPGIQLYRSQRSTAFNAEAVVIPDGEPSAALDLPDTDEGKLDPGVYAPLRARLGVGFYFGDRGFISLEGDIQPGLENEDLELDRTFVWNARLGGNWNVSDRIILGAGLFTDRDATREQDAYRKIHYYGATLGARFLIIHRLQGDRPNDSLSLSSTFALRYAHGEGAIEGIRIEEDLDVGTRSTDMVVNEYTLNVSSSVGF